VRAMTFNDANLITALGNDCGYENWIAKAPVKLSCATTNLHPCPRSSAIMDTGFSSSAIAKPKVEARAMDVEVTAETLEVALTDGRRVSAPLEWFPRLRDASEKQRANWRLIGPGIGIHWDEIDEDVSVRRLLVGEV
jgi:hypothetical protein